MTDFKAKMHQIRFRLGLRPPRWGSLQRSSRPLAGFGGLLLRRGKGKGGDGRGEGRRGKGKGGEGKGHEPPHYLEEVYAYGLTSVGDFLLGVISGGGVQGESPFTAL